MTLSVTIAPGPQVTQILVVDGQQVCLKGRLLCPPSHPRAMQWLLEAIALWQGKPVRAVLCAGKQRRTYAMTFRADWFPDFGGPLYQLEVIDERQVRTSTVLHDHIDGLGRFGDLKRMRRYTTQCDGSQGGTK